MQAHRLGIALLASRQTQQYQCCGSTNLEDERESERTLNTLHFKNRMASLVRETTTEKYRGLYAHIFRASDGTHYLFLACGYVKIQSQSNNNRKMLTVVAEVVDQNNFRYQMRWTPVQHTETGHEL